MAFLIDQLNNSGLFAQSAYSASIATYDSNGNEITATYLTGVDLTPYQTTADMINYQTVSGMTAYATTGDVANKLDTTAFSDVSGTFLTAHQSLDDYATTAWVDSQGYLTAHQPISADEWNNVYDTVNVYSGSWTGSETSPTASVDSNGSIDIVSSNNTVYFDVNGTWFNDAVNSALPTSSVQWNSNYETVNTNSGVWGGSALNISAGEGVKVTLANNNLVFSTDETVLWSGTAAPSNFPLTMSEPFSLFEKIEFVWNPRYNGDYGCPTYCTQLGTEKYGSSVPTKYTLVGEYANASQIWKEYWYLENDNNGNTLSSYKALYWPGTGGTNSATQTNCRLFKVVGINRKNNI
jgi:hypothetical protein